MVQESTKLQKEGLDTGADLAPLGRSEVEVIEEKTDKIGRTKKSSFSVQLIICGGVKAGLSRAGGDSSYCYSKVL